MKHPKYTPPEAVVMVTVYVPVVDVGTFTIASPNAVSAFTAATVPSGPSTVIVTCPMFSRQKMATAPADES